MSSSPPRSSLTEMRTPTPWKVYGISCRTPTPSPTDDALSVKHIPYDISDFVDALAKISPLIDVTHVFYVTWVARPIEEENRTVNSAMLSNVLAAFLPSATNLQLVCLQIGCKHYFGPFESILRGSYIPHDPPYHEDLLRLNVTNFYYDMEDILFEELLKRGRAVSWTDNCLNTIFSYSPSSLMNIIGTICVNVVICRGEGMDLRWPGSWIAWEGFGDASDIDLIVEHQIWAAVDPFVKNEEFNCSNEDVFKWKKLWPLQAE